MVKLVPAGSTFKDERVKAMNSLKTERNKSNKKKKRDDYQQDEEN